MEKGKRTDEALIIFYRNPVPGKVKTRLAADVGDVRALEIYLQLARHTQAVTEALPFDKIVFYSEAIGHHDFWNDMNFRKQVQIPGDLGVKMNHAFLHCFREGYKSVCIIGTDCYELTASLLAQAFEKLSASDTVIGPARDGGYYLLGLKKPYPDLFLNKQWSHRLVFEQACSVIRNGKLSLAELPLLRDVDTIDDLPEHLRYF